MIPDEIDAVEKKIVHLSMAFDEMATILRYYGKRFYVENVERDLRELVILVRENQR